MLLQYLAPALFEKWSLRRLVSEAHASCRVLHESYDERGARLRVLARPAVLSRLQAEVAG